MKLEEKLYTSTEVAKILGVSLRSVYRYLEQDKLEAEIKTATGRLRFTRQNILDFLYPDSDPLELEGKDISLPKEEPTSSELEEDAKTADPDKSTEEAKLDRKHAEEEEVDLAADIQEKELATEEKKEEPEEVESKDAPEVEEASEDIVEEDEEEEVDWLSKFKEAAKQYEETTKKAEPVQRKETAEAVSSLGSDEDEAPVKEEAPKEVSFKYYKSMLGGLKEIAQNIDKISRKSGVDYAFTLYSGLSLEKPLNKPFSILHLYIAPESEQLFKKMLQLEETSESNAQVCLMPATDTKIFANKTEKHGLFVVSNEQLAEDFKLFGLEEELEELL